MFSDNKKRKAAIIDSLIGGNSEFEGNVKFSGGFHIGGKLVGNVTAHEPSSLLTLSEGGIVKGEVRVPRVVLNGTVIGDVHASERIELTASAKVTGNVYYNLIEMTTGAEVNGSLIYQGNKTHSAVEEETVSEKYASTSGG